MEQSPTLGRVALLALVDWMIKHRDRSVCIESHGMGSGSQRKAFPFDQPIRGDGDKCTKESDARSKS